MRVLHINAGNLYGGIETLLTTLARCRGLCPTMQPEFAVCFEGRSAQELRQTEVPVHRLMPVRISRPWTVWRARQLLRRYVAEREIDVGICHGSWSHALFAPVLARQGRPVVFWAHGPFPPGQWLDHWANRTAPDLVLANTRWTRKTMGLFRSAPTEVLHYPVADGSRPDREASRREVRAELGTPLDAVVIVLASRLAEWKGHDLLLDALLRLSGNRNWECWIAGGPQRSDEERYLARLQAKVRAGKLAERVRFLGQRHDVGRLLSAADVHCQPNTQPEPFGIAFVEALYAGLPVVTMAHGGAVEVLDESCAVLVPAPFEGGVLAEALLRLIERPALREQLRANGPVRAKVISDPAARLQDLQATLRSLAA